VPVQIVTGQMQTVAANIVAIARTKEGAWMPFSWEVYVVHCGRAHAETERISLSTFVDRGVLNIFDRQYYVTERFKHLFSELIEIPEG